MNVRRVLVTGAGGNLGVKLIRHLLGTPWCEAIVALDARPLDAGLLGDLHGKTIDLVSADLRDGTEGRWRAALQGADAIVHLAAQNPAPDAPWPDALVSFDMSAHLAAAAAAAGVRRLVFASSNHTMGQYKDAPLAATIGPGRLATDLPPGPGTIWFDGQTMRRGSAYGVSKLMGERVFNAAAALSEGRLTSVSVRIGWCQPGANDARTINPSGVVGGRAAVEYPDLARDLAWFRGMWLSNRDYCQIMERALLASAEGWPAPGIVVNGMSANKDMVWEIETARHLIGYAPQDDIFREIG